MYVLLFDLLMHVYLVKEINRLISKGMYVLVFDISNGFLKTDILKTSILSERKFEDMHYL